MSGNQPFAQYTFVIATPDNVSVHPGLHIRAVAVLMHKQRTARPTLYIKRPSSTSLSMCHYQHKLEGIEDGRLFHRAVFTELAGLEATAAVHWQDPAPHTVELRPAAKMDAHGLVQAICSCGNYTSTPDSEAAARLAGTQHATSLNERERYAV